jgi:hypothetical protein
MSDSTLTATVYNLYPTYSSAVTSPAGGSWGAKTISVRLVAWYTLDETDVDSAGINRNSVASWNNITVSASDYVTFTAILPLQHYNHLAFYYQVGASWDSANAATKCTATIQQTSSTSVTVTVLNDDDTATVTFGATANSISINMIEHIQPIFRENTVRAFDGSLVKKSYVTEQAIDSLDLTLTMASLSASEIKTLSNWIKDSTKLKMSEDLSGDDIYIKDYYGKFVSCDYLHTKYKRTGYTFNVTFAVDAETEEVSSP